MIKYKKKIYYEEMFDNRKINPKGMWKTLKELINSKKGKSIKYDKIQ